MTKLSKFWTASIAYVALIVGAGSSVVFNILDMRSLRGDAFDGWDLFIAVLGPAMVVLMVEMFVSRLWEKLPPFAGQFIRWTGTVAIGAVAMRVSWTHGHAFLLTRGQTADVATMWPLAIDTLAIMATALLVAGRRGQLGHVATGGQLASGQWPDAEELTMMATHVNDQMASGHEPGQPWAGPVASEEDVAISEAAFRGQNWPPFLDQLPDVAIPRMADVEWVDATATQPMDPSWDIAAEAEQMLSAPATVKDRPPVISGVPEQAREFIAKMLEQNAQSKEIDEAVSEMCMVSPRTARRYRAVVTEQLNREEK